MVTPNYILTKQLPNSNLNSLPVIDSGKITATVTKAAVTNITIPFTKEFSEAPILTFSWITSQMTAKVSQ